MNSMCIALFESKVNGGWIVPVCAGEASEESIHMVPFQFDLIQLLPKCQQVEIFFLTYSTGTIPICTITNNIINVCHDINVLIAVIYNN